MIVVTHRGPVSFTPDSDGGFAATRGAGGVVSAFAPLMAETGGMWVAAAMDEGDRAAVKAGAAVTEGFDLRMIDLDPQAHRLHYDLVSNAVLWPLHHGLFDLVRRPRFDRRFREAWDAYTEVNRTFAGLVAESAPEGDAVLVQDYQLALVPGLLRQARPDLAVVHFSHTPFCGPDSIRILPDAMSWALCSSLASVPSGFHTARWARSYQASVREVLGPGVPVTTPFVSALGPDPADLARVAASEETAAAAAALETLVEDRLVLARVDRVEPSKNIVRGFAAYDLLLEEHPHWRGRVVFVALVYPSRESLPEYLAYRQEVEQAAAAVNRRWGEPAWTPVLLDTNDHFPTSVAALCRYDVLVVNPMRDGLNLVAKEGPLLNRREGVLCLSRGAGAFDELGEAAVEVHPFDILQTAQAMHTALSLTPPERTDRAARLRELVAARTAADWLDDLLAQSRTAASRSSSPARPAGPSTW
jgi:trehalose 6-phosphate synthase